MKTIFMMNLNSILSILFVLFIRRIFFLQDHQENLAVVLEDTVFKACCPPVFSGGVPYQASPGSSCNRIYESRNYQDRYSDDSGSPMGNRFFLLSVLLFDKL